MVTVVCILLTTTATRTNVQMPRLRQRGGNIGRRTRSAISVAAARESQNVDQRERRLADQRERNHEARVAANPQIQPRRTPAQVVSRNFARREVHFANRANVELYKAAFEYNSQANYRQHKFVQIGVMDRVCAFCNALKFPNESDGLCCANGKVRLPALLPVPEPLQMLINGTTTDSQHFLRHIQAYNNAFQMTSFGATQIVNHGYMPTF